MVLKLVPVLLFATVGTTAALAQNMAMPVAGAAEQAPTRIVRAVGVTALGTYADRGKERLIDVSLDADSDGDGSKDQGVLHVACNGGDLLNAQFRAGESTDAARPKVKAVKAAAASALFAGKAFKGSWDLRQVREASSTNAPVPLTVGPGGPDICA